MKKNPVLLGVLVAAVSFSFIATSFAGLINYKRKAAREAARTGGAPPAADAQTWTAQWMQELPSVRNSTERGYDVNRDGVLQTAEVKIFLRDVAYTVNRRGRYRVVSEILREYDTDKDGVIDKTEVKRIEADVK